MDPVIKTLKHLGIPLTRQNYIDLNSLGGKPQKLDPETEAELPDEPRFKAFRETTHEEVAEKEDAKENGEQK